MVGIFISRNRTQNTNYAVQIGHHRLTAGPNFSDVYKTLIRVLGGMEGMPKSIQNRPYGDLLIQEKLQEEIDQKDIEALEKIIKMHNQLVGIREALDY